MAYLIAAFLPPVFVIAILLFLFAPLMGFTSLYASRQRRFRRWWSRTGIGRWVKRREGAERWVTFVLFIVAIGLLLLSEKGDIEILSSDLMLNLGTEILGGIAIYFAFEFVADRNLKTRLLAQMGSSVRDVAVAATEELRRYGWLIDGSLQGADLLGANLEEARLRGASLQGADLGVANLRRTDFRDANLKRVVLRGANLQEAVLFLANLEEAILTIANLEEAVLAHANMEGACLLGANLKGAVLKIANLKEANLGLVNLQGADLWRANLQRANLARANLQGADLRYANLQGTELPDETKWTPDTDMTRFTDPDHPEFWRSNDSASPAYRGDDTGA